MSYAMAVDSPRNPKRDGDYFKFVDGAMAVHSPRIPKRDREGADDDSSKFVTKWHCEEAVAVDDDDFCSPRNPKCHSSKEAEEWCCGEEADYDYDTSKLVPRWLGAESVAADDVDYYKYIIGVSVNARFSGIRLMDIPVLENYPKQERNCGDFVCQGPHLNHSFGDFLWDLISIKIRRNMNNKPDLQPVRIYGEVAVCNPRGYVDYLYKRPRDKPQVFDNPGEELALALEGPEKLEVLEGGLGGVTLHALLKYNNKDIFPVTDTHSRGGCRDVRGDMVGCGVFWASIEDPYFSIAEFCTDPAIEEVASVQVGLGMIYGGLAAVLEITSLRDLGGLYGEITARPCLRKEAMVLFHKAREEAVEVKSNEEIPLSRRMPVVSGNSSLIINVNLQDAKDSNFLLVETIHFNVGLFQCTSQKLMSNGVIKVTVKWTLFQRFSYPRAAKNPPWKMI